MSPLSFSGRSIKREGWYDEDSPIDRILYAVGNGTVLPKGHGRLIDADEFARFLKDVSKWHHYNKLCLDSALTVADVFDAICADLKGKGIFKFETCPTILEADKEGQDG